MAALPQSGIEMVAKGASAYISDIDRAAKATDKFGDGLGSVAGKAGGFSTVMTGALMRVGEVAVDALGRAAQATGQFLADSVTSAADVEQILAVMGATSGATAAQLEQVRDTAIALGGDLTLPATSAQDASEAMLELTKAGFSVDEAMAAAKGTLQLAAAAQVDAGEAAAITAQAINAFGLEASDAAHIADLLAGGANASSASMTDLAQGLQQGGFAFDAAGQNVDDLVVSLAALTNVGLTGSDAGTALKNAMMRLMNPTEKAAGLMKDLGIQAYDAQGNMKPWPELLEHIRKATAGMTQEERNAALGTIFLSDGMKAMIPLLDMTAEEYAALEASVTKAGSAQEVAGAQTQGFNGAIAGLQSQMETLQLIIGTKLLPLLTPLIQQVSGVASAIGGITTAVLDAGLGSSEFLESLGLLDAALGLMPGSAEGVYMAMTKIGESAQSAAAFVQANLVPILSAAAAVILAVAVPAFVAWATAASAAAIATITALAPVVIPLVAIGAAAAILGLAWQENWGGIQETTTAAWAAIEPQLKALWEWLGTTIPPIIQQLADFFNTVILPAVTAFAGFVAGTLLPALVNLFHLGLAVVAQGALNLSKQFSDFLQPAIAAVSGFIEANAQPAMENMEPVMKALADVGSTVSGAFDGIAKAIGGAVSKVKEFIEWAAKIKVPALVTPGSPTPLEIGMRGIASATDLAASAFMDKFNVALAQMPAQQVSAIAKPSMGGGSSSTTNSRVLNFSPVYGGSVRPSPAMDVSLARSLAL